MVHQATNETLSQQLLSLRYEVDDQEEARHITSTETPLTNAIDKAIPLVECAHRPSGGRRPTTP